MKKNLISLLFALLPIMGVGQTTVPVYPSTQIDAMIRHLNARIDSVIKAMPQSPVIPPVGPNKDPCKAGPTLNSISNASVTYLNFNFYGQDVFSIDWRIINSVNFIARSGSVSPTNDRPGITFSTLEPGVYTLELEGGNCKSSASRKTFTIGSTGVVDPPVIVVPPVVIPDGQAKVIPQVLPFPGHMKLEFIRTSGGWLVSDLLTKKQSGLEDNKFVFYEINGKRIVVDQLINWFVSEKNILIDFTKSSMDPSVSRWWQTSQPHGGDPSKQGYFQGIAYAARASYVIVGNGSNAIPATYDPYNNQNTQWQNLLPDRAQSDRFQIVTPVGETSLAKLFSKGVNRFSMYALSDNWTKGGEQYKNQGYGYNEVPTSPYIFGWNQLGGPDDWIGPRGRDANGVKIDNWPFVWNLRMIQTPVGAQEPMTFEQGREAGRRYDTGYTLNVFETAEGGHAIAPIWEFIRGFSMEWHNRLEIQWPGKTILTAWNYFTDFGVNSVWETADKRKALFRSELYQWPGSPMLPGGILERFTAYCIPMYYNFPDAGFDIAYELAFQYYVQKKTGKHAIIFPAASLENNPNGLVEWRLPEGKYYHKNKLPQDPNVLFTAGALGRVFCKAIVPWAFPAENSKPFRVNMNYIDGGNEWVGLWVPNGNRETQIGDAINSIVMERGNHVAPSQGTTDNLMFGKNLAESTFGLTDGGVDEWLRVRKDGGKWVDPVNDWADDPINARENGGVLAFSRRLNGVISVMICDPKTIDTDAHTYEFQFGGKTYSETHAGITPFMKNYAYATN